MTYKAFISYSHDADGEFVESLHEAMEKLAKRWNQRRARQVVLDKTAMAAGASLGDTINEKLRDSEWLILLAAPGSAQSRWCDDEIDYWNANKSMKKVVVALTGGDIVVNADGHRVDWERTTALSERFREAVGDDAVPLYEDLRPFRNDVEHATLRNPQFRDEVAKIVGRMEDVDPGELASTDKRQYAHTVRLRRAAEIGLVLLTVAALVFGVRSVISEQRAVENEVRAIAGEAQAELNAKEAVANAELAQENEREAVANADLAERNAEEARRNEAQAVLEAERAKSSALASQAIALAPEVPDAAALLALEAVRVAPTVDAFIGVVNSIASNTHFLWRATVPDEPIVQTAAWSTDGTTVVVGTEFGDVLVSSGEDVASAEVPRMAGEVLSVAFVDDTPSFRVLDASGRLTTWDSRDSSQDAEVRLSNGVFTGRISSDGSTVVVVEQQGDDGCIDDTEGGCTFTTFDAAGNPLATIEPELPLSICIFRCLAIRGDGSQVAWGEEGGEFGLDVVTTWNGGSRSTQMFEPIGFLESLAYLPSGETIIVADDEDFAYLVDADTSRLTVAEEPTFVGDAEFLSYAFAGPFEDGTQLMVSGHLNGSVGIWEFDEATASGLQVGNLTRHNDEVHSVAVSPDGGSIVSGSWDGDVISWRTVASSTSGLLNFDAHEGRINDVALIGSEARAVSVADDGFIRMWDIGGSGELAEIRAIDLTNEFFAEVEGVDVSPDGQQIAVGASLYSVDEEDGFSVDYVLLILDARSGAEIDRIFLPDVPTSVSFSVNGEWLVAGTSFEGVVVWDTDALGGDPDYVFDAYADTSGGVALSADGRLLAAATLDGLSVGLWDLSTGEIIQTIEGNPNSEVTAVALNEMGTTLAWGDNTRLISLWDVEGQKRIGENLTGHTQPITDLAFTDIDGDGVDAVLTSTSADGSVRVWEILARRLVARIEAHFSDATAVDIDVDTNLMITSSHDGSLWVGDLRPESWVAAACTLAGRNMSEEEWDALPGDELYVSHCAEFPPGVGAPQNADVWTFAFDGVDAGAT